MWKCTHFEGFKCTLFHRSVLIMYLWSLAFIIDIIGHLNIVYSVYSFNQCIACIFTEFKSMFVKYWKLFFIILIECVYYTQLCSNPSVENRFVAMLHSQNIHHWNVPSEQTNKLRGNRNENIFAKIPNKKWTTTATAFIIKEKYVASMHSRREMQRKSGSFRK